METPVQMSDLSKGNRAQRHRELASQLLIAWHRGEVQQDSSDAEDVSLPSSQRTTAQYLLRNGFEAHLWFLRHDR